MRFGFCLPHDGELSLPRNIVALAQHAEKLGFDTLVEPSDHLIMPNTIRTVYPYSTSGEYTDTTEDLDQATTLAFLASKTSKIRLMTGISVVPYRNPIALANAY
ncbi:MAG TPA: LLM class flavin-dependent oxidoreductase, partial [Nitrososphaerales archaeon]|nr:LLM class flavin-dependent oxidoreductase [Nitrososphaerales archaeon]